MSCPSAEARSRIVVRGPRLSIREELVCAHEQGTFLEAVMRPDLHGDEAGLVAEIVSLHNEGVVDVVEEFDGLVGTPGFSYFLARGVFEKALPQLHGPVPEIMRCVARLFAGAGQDLAAGTIIGAFRQFLDRDPGRPVIALAEIREDPKNMIDLIPPVLESGSRADGPAFLREAVTLCADENSSIRQRAVFSLGRLSVSEDPNLSEEVLLALEEAVAEETDDGVIAAALRSGFELMQAGTNPEGRALALIVRAVEKGGPITLHAMTEVLAFHPTEIPDSLWDDLAPHLPLIDPSNRGTVDLLDHLAYSQFQAGAIARAQTVLETVLQAHRRELNMEAFDSTAFWVASHPDVLGSIMTRWFLKGDPSLCQAVVQIVATHHGSTLVLEVDPAQLGDSDSAILVYLARKAVGYLFFQSPVAASVVVSIMRRAGGESTMMELSRILLNPLLLSYTGEAKQFIESIADTQPALVAAALQRTLADLDVYLQGLSGARGLTALRPSEAHREARHRHMSRLMAQSLKAAEASSVILSLVTRNVLLYGRRSVDYHAGYDGETHRMEHELQAHSFELEMPRLDTLDPVGLDYTLRVFRAERPMQCD